MISNYVFYLYTLSNEQKLKELLILFIFSICFFILCIFLDALKKQKSRF